MAVRNTDVGSAEIRSRLSDVCGEIDNARRLRNLSMHNNDKYNERYISDAIIQDGVNVKYERSSSTGVLNREPVFITFGRVEEFFYSHIELLHVLHNTIQRRYFGADRDYNYVEEGKQEELYRMVSGRRDVGF
jgi:hypothetical protein